MSVGKRDPHTGHMTTGHNWNGITELNSPVPKVVWVVLSLAALFSIAYWVLMPAWPTLSSFTRGTLGVDQRTDVAKTLSTAARQREPWQQRLAQNSVTEIAQDPELSIIASEGGSRLFGDNCAVCHGMQGSGGPGYPTLNDSYWLWGKNPQEILETLRVGINSAHPETRSSQMPAFSTMRGNQLSELITYIRSLSALDSNVSTQDHQETVSAGGSTFSAMCAACHGANATGNIALGAPDLTDAAWIYGGDVRSLRHTIQLGRAGEMPAWEKRLSLVDRKMLVLHLLQISGQAPVNRTGEKQ